jgi:hypothetical protein
MDAAKRTLEAHVHLAMQAMKFTSILRDAPDSFDSSVRRVFGVSFLAPTLANKIIGEFRMDLSRQRLCKERFDMRALNI